MRTILLGCAWFVSVALTACGANDPDKHPAEALTRFLEAMDRTAHDETALKDAFVLLDEQTQRELTARAERTSSLAGRNFAPWEMIAQGRFRLRFAPAEHTEMRATIAGPGGDHATVHVKGDNGREAAVPLVREGGHWRVKLELPAIAQNTGARTRNEPREPRDHP
jgi:hypothetical protein